MWDMFYCLSNPALWAPTHSTVVARALGPRSGYCTSSASASPAHKSTQLHTRPPRPRVLIPGLTAAKGTPRLNTKLNLLGRRDLGRRDKDRYDVFKGYFYRKFSALSHILFYYI